MTIAPEPAAPPRAGRTLLGLLLAGAAVAVLLGVYGRVHTPTGIAVNVAGFSGPLEVKSWLATVVVLLALVQLGSALMLYGRLPGAGSWTGPLHRWSGRAAFLLTVPIAVHCLYALGFQAFDTRTLLHSLAGCSTYGDEPAGAPSTAAPPAGDEPLATVSEVPVGSGVIKGKVVVTQPQAGTIKAFSTTCTHQGCAVTAVTGDRITCPCHGSAFAVADGAPTKGPATRPLSEVPVTVDGDRILPA